MGKDSELSNDVVEFEEPGSNMTFRYRFNIKSRQLYCFDEWSQTWSSCCIPGRAVTQFYTALQERGMLKE